MNLVFDFAGVVFRWDPPVLLRRHLPRHCTDATGERALADAIFQGWEGDWGAFDRGEIDQQAAIARIVRRTGLPAAGVRAVVEAVPTELQPDAATVELLRRLRARGDRLFFLSNMPAPYAAHLERAHDFLAVFEQGLYSGRVGLAKPDPALFAHAEHCFGLPAAELVFFDDVTANVESARAAGWTAHRFTDAAECAAVLGAVQDAGVSDASDSGSA